MNFQVPRGLNGIGYEIDSSGSELSPLKIAVVNTVTNLHIP
jgi:hypothetical protein